MSRTIDSALNVELTGDSTAPIFLGKFEFPSADVNIWTGYGELVFAGDTYTGGGQLIGISPIGETQLLRAAGVEFSLTGLPSANLSLSLNEDYSERPATLWLGVIDATKSLVGTPIIIFKGRMDVMSIRESGETTDVTISVENRLIDLERAKERRYTDEDQQKQFLGDLGLEFVVSLNDGKEITWGKA